MSHENPEIARARQLVIDQLNENANRFLTLWERPEHVFTLQPTKMALIVVDMQKYYCASGLGRSLDNLEETIKNINAVVDLCHQMNIPVIWLRQNFTTLDGKSDAGLYEVLHKQPLAKGLCNLHEDTCIYPEFHLDDLTDYQITKNRYSAFINNSSNLHETLQKLERTQLVFTGIVANVCVESNIRDAMQLDYEVILLSDATTSFDRVILEVSILNTKIFLGDVYTTHTFIEALKETET